VRATAVGPDLARSTVRLERLKRSSDEQAAEASDDLADSPDEDEVDPDTDDDLAEGDPGDRALPLTA
jgi:hypothetical protein